MNSQRFREVFLEGVDASNQLSLPELQQQNFLFDWTYSINHNLTKSLRFTFNSSTSNIIRNEMDDFSDIFISKPKEIWEGIWNTGEPDRHFQSLSLNYKVPLNLIPVLSFLDIDYSYTGDFSWQRGSEALANVKNEIGQTLGVVNQIQNANTKSVNGSISFKKLYAILNLDKDIKDRKKQGDYDVKSLGFNYRMTDSEAALDGFADHGRLLRFCITVSDNY